MTCPQMRPKLSRVLRGLLVFHLVCGAEPSAICQLSFAGLTTVSSTCAVARVVSTRGDFFYPIPLPLCPSFVLLHRQGVRQRHGDVPCWPRAQHGGGPGGAAAQQVRA